MNLKNKRIISISSIIIFMLVIPLIIASVQDIKSVLLSILIMVIDPILSIFIGIIIGEDYKDLWYIPIIEILLFLLFFFITFEDVATEYLLFAIIYLTLSVTSIIITNLIQKKT